MTKHRRKILPTEPVEAIIETLSHDGRGIAHVNGKITFITNALPQEKILFQYTNRHGSFDEGEAINILQSSKDRITPVCQFYNLCGGCSLQHLNENKQIEHKQQVLIDQLKHFGNVEPEEILLPLTGPVWGYRHKARLGVRFVIKKERLLIGFREKNGRFIADLDCCEVLDPSIGKKIIELRDFISLLDGFKNIPQIEIAVGDEKTALIIRHLEALSQHDKKALIEFAKQSQFDLYLQPGNLETVHKIWPENTPDRLSYQLKEEKVELFFHPSDFTQINPRINQQMVSRVIELLNPNKKDIMMDLFCGLGNFTIPLAKYVQRIIGIEGNSRMVDRAKENAIHNQITNAEFYLLDLTQSIDQAPWNNEPFNKILIDPPRSGALEFIQQLPKLKGIRTLVYVSCNPATLSRDINELVHNQGFQLKKAGIMDMFPHTTHVESIALLTK